MLRAVNYLPIDRVILNLKFFVIDGQKYDYMSIWFVGIVEPAVNFNVNLIGIVWIRNHYESHHLLLHIRPELWYLLLCGFHMQHIWVYDIMINWYWFSDQKQTIQFKKPRIWFETCDFEIIKGWTFSARTHTERLTVPNEPRHVRCFCSQLCWKLRKNNLFNFAFAKQRRLCSTKEFYICLGITSSQMRTVTSNWKTLRPSFWVLFIYSSLLSTLALHSIDSDGNKYK